MDKTSMLEDILQEFASRKLVTMTLFSKSDIETAAKAYMRYINKLRVRTEPERDMRDEDYDDMLFLNAFSAALTALEEKWKAEGLMFYIAD